MKEVLLILTSILSSVISGSIVFIWTRRKYKAETRSAELDNIQKAVSIWRNLAKDLEEELKSLKKEFSELKDQMTSLQENFIKKCEQCKYRKYYQDNHPTRG